MWENSPQNCQNFEFWPEISTSRANRLQYFYEILSVCTRLQVAFKILVQSLWRDKHPSYKYFPAVGAFSHKFSIARSGETTDRKKSYGMQKWDAPPLSPCEVYGVDPGSRAGCRRKSVIFLSAFCHALK